MNEEKIIQEIEIIDEVKEKAKQPIRDTLYGGIDISLRTMDRFITIVMILLLISIIMAMVSK